MTETLPLIFKKRLQEAFDASGMSMRTLSLQSDLSEARVHKMLRGQFDNSKAGPGFFGMVRLCRVLNITPDYLAGVSKWNGDPAASGNLTMYAPDSSGVADSMPSIRELMRRFVRSGQRIEAFEDLMDYCDVYDLPDTETKRIIIREVGKKSLSAQRMGENSPVILQEAIDNMSHELRDKIFANHCLTIQEGFVAEPDFINEMMPNKPIFIRIDYLRTSMLVLDGAGSPSLLIFCEMMPQ